MITAEGFHRRIVPSAFLSSATIDEREAVIVTVGSRVISPGTLEGDEDISPTVLIIREGVALPAERAIRPESARAVFRMILGRCSEPSTI